MFVELHGAVGGYFRAHIGPEAFANGRRVLLADEAERHLGGGFRGDHGLETIAGIAADNAVDFRRWPRPGLLQHGATLFARGNRKADFAEKGFGRAAQRFPGGLDVGWGFFHAVIKA
ncbi:hypothetical protein D3C78_1418280 [compost metagenome]